MVRKICRMIYTRMRFANKKIIMGRNIHITKDSDLAGYNRIYDNVNIYSSKIESRTYISKNTKIMFAEIGKYCSIGENVQIGLGEHPSSIWVSTHPAFFSTNKQAGFSFVSENRFDELGKRHINIVVGNDVWIGNNAILLNGVNVGDGAIIAAGAVVTKNVPSYAIVGGVPSKIIGYRFSGPDIEWLMKFRWWDKNEKWIVENADYFNDINRLILFVENNSNKIIEK